MQPKVSKGVATWAGLVAAAGQYAAAVAVYLDNPDNATALEPLTTATVTLLAVIYGRMTQAKALLDRSSWGEQPQEVPENDPAAMYMVSADPDGDDLEEGCANPFNQEQPHGNE